MSAQNFLIEGLELNFSTSPYHFFPTQLKLLKVIADSTNIREENTAVNLLRITSCTAFIETILYESLIAVVSQKKNEQPDEMLKRILIQKESLISTATFKDFERLSEECLGKRLSAYTTSDTWETIKVLFILRNQVAHGKKLSIRYKYQNDAFIGEPERNYIDVINFLKKRKFLDDDDVNFSSIFENRPVEFFIEITKEFFVDVTKNISAEFSTPTYNGFEHIRESLSVVQ